MKKITAIILVVLLAISLVGCGGSGEEEIKKISTLEEMDAEIEANWDYEALGLTKEKDDFSESYTISEAEDFYEKVDFENLLKNINNDPVYGSVMFGYGEAKNDPLVCQIFATIMLQGETDLVLENKEVESILISNGEDILKIDDKYYFGISPVAENPEMSQLGIYQATIILPASSDDQVLKALSETSDQLKMRIEVVDNGAYIPDCTFSEELDKQFKESLKQYLDLKEKCDTEKIKFGV